MKWLRRLMPLGVVLLWLVAGGIGGPYFGKISDVSSNDLSTFLPSSAESTKVKDELKKFQDKSVLPAIIVFESEKTLTDDQKVKINTIRTKLEDDKQVDGKIAPASTSEDEKAALLVVPINSDADMKVAVPKIQATVAEAKPSMNYKFTGPAMFSRDLNKAFAGIDGTLLLVALAVVFVILLIVYRSPLLPIITLTSALLALASAIFVVWHFANAGIMQLNGQVQGILFILVIGAATDYALLYIARYREELSHHQSARQATVVAWKAAWEPIVAAGGTVSLGLLCLLASDLGSNKALGPVGGIGIFFAVLSALTFLPSVLLLFGRAAFWPRYPRHTTNKQQIDYREDHPTWTKVGVLVGKIPRILWVSILILLAIACYFVPQLKADGVSQDNLVIGKSEARDGQAMLNRHFPSGSGSPVFIIAPHAKQSEIVDLLEANKGVDTISVQSSDEKMPILPLGRQAVKIRSEIRQDIIAEQGKKMIKIRSQIAANMPPGTPDEVIDTTYNQMTAGMPTIDEIAQKADPFAGIESKVIDGKEVIQATLKDSPSSVTARKTVQHLRSTIQDRYPEVKFGGVSAIQLDTNNASTHDLKIIIPLILVVITVVLMLLLRSIVAPLILLFTTVLSFGTTLGTAALLFNHVWHFPGGDPAIIIFGFVFLVALGIDYNIFLMTRVREETKKLGVRKGTLKALVVTGGVITSAGIVLASTFAALYVIPILFLAQIAFIVSFGVLLDTLIVRSLLVPSLTLEIGRFMWWPSKLSQSKKK